MSEEEVAVDQQAGLIEGSDSSTEPEIKPEDVATLSLGYRDGKPVLTVPGGVAIPGGIAVENDNGQIVAIYKAETQATTRTRSFPPVNQLYSLQEPVQLYQRQGDPVLTDEPAGVLEGFNVIVNQSSVPGR